MNGVTVTAQQAPEFADGADVAPSGGGIRTRAIAQRRAAGRAAPAAG